MEIITIIIQAVATLITTLLANFFRSKVDKSFDKEEYCRNYLISQKNVNQQNNAINSGTISHSSVNVVQNNTNITNSVTVNHSNNSSSDSSLKLIFIVFLTIAGITIFIATFGLLKYKYHFDYWYPILLTLSSSICLHLFSKNVLIEKELYWKKQQYFASILSIFAILFIANFYLVNNSSTLQCLEQIKLIVSSSTSLSEYFANIFNFFIHDINTVSNLLYKILPLISLILFIVIDIYEQLRYKKPILNVNLILFINIGILIVSEIINLFSNL